MVQAANKRIVTDDRLAASNTITLGTAATDAQNKASAAQTAAIAAASTDATTKANNAQAAAIAAAATDATTKDNAAKAAAIAAAATDATTKANAAQAAAIATAHDTAVADAATAGDAKYATLSALNSISTPRRYARPKFTLVPRTGSWTVSGTGVTLNATYADPSPIAAPVTGTSVQLTSPGTSGITKLLRVTNTATWDMTGKMIGFWLKIPDMTHVSSMTVYLYAADGTSYFQFNVQLVAAKNIHPGEWSQFVLPWAPSATSGTPSRAAVQALRFNFLDDGAGVPITYQVADTFFTVPEPSGFPNGALSIAFDDSYDLSLAQPRLAQYGIPATLFPILGSLDGNGKLATADARKWVDTLGWEVAGHAATQADHVSLSTLSSADQVANLSRLRAAMNTTGFTSPIYATPNAANDIVSDSNIRQFFSACRGGANDNESLPPARLMYLRSYFSGSSVTAAQLQTMVDRALAAKSWAIITFHGVVASNPDSLGTLQTTFNTFVDYVAGLSIEKMTIGDVFNRLVP